MRKHSRSLVICIFARVWMKQFHSLKVQLFGLLVRFKGQAFGPTPSIPAYCTVQTCHVSSWDVFNPIACQVVKWYIESSPSLPFLGITIPCIFFDKSLLKDFLSQLPGKYCDASLALFQAVTSFHHQAVGIISLNKTNAVDAVENGSGTSVLRFYASTQRARKQPGSIWVFPEIGVPQNGWFIMENPIKIDDLGVPLFLETPIYGNSILYGLLRMCRLSNPYFVPLAAAPLFFSSGCSTGFWMTRQACNVYCVCWKAGCGRFTICSTQPEN